MCYIFQKSNSEFCISYKIELNFKNDSHKYLEQSILCYKFVLLNIIFTCSSASSEVSTSPLPSIFKMREQQDDIVSSGVLFPPIDSPQIQSHRLVWPIFRLKVCLHREEVASRALKSYSWNLLILFMTNAAFATKFLQQVNIGGATI